MARQGKRWSGAAFFLQSLPTAPENGFRFGLTASRKVGGAVVRNRAKRRLREMVRAQMLRQPLRGHDVVIIAKTAAATHDFAAMQADFERGLRKLGVLT